MAIIIVQCNLPPANPVFISPLLRFFLAPFFEFFRHALPRILYLVNFAGNLPLALPAIWAFRELILFLY